MVAFGVQHFILHRIYSRAGIRARVDSSIYVFGASYGCRAHVRGPEHRLPKESAPIRDPIGPRVLPVRAGAPRARHRRDSERRGRAHPGIRVVGQFGFGGRAILPRGPLRGRLSAGSGRLKGGCGQDWPPSKSKLTQCHHLWVPGLIAGLIPAWIPWHRFWVYFAAAGFMAAAACIAIGKQVRRIRPESPPLHAVATSGTAGSLHWRWPDARWRPPLQDRRTGREACPTKCYDPLLWSKSDLPQYYAWPGWDAWSPPPNRGRESSLRVIRKPTRCSRR